MNRTGVVKHIDRLGRFKIPKEFLHFYNISPNSNLEISKKRNTILLKNASHNCIFCFSTQNIQLFKGKEVCKNCIHHLSKLIVKEKNNMTK